MSDAVRDPSGKSVIDFPDRGIRKPKEPPGGNELEARVAKLEVHAEYIRRDLDEMKGDLKTVHDDLSTIKRRMAYFAGAAFIVAAIFGWIVNNRFDQVLGLLTKAS